MERWLYTTWTQPAVAEGRLLSSNFVAVSVVVDLTLGNIQVVVEAAVGSTVVVAAAVGSTAVVAAAVAVAAVSDTVCTYLAL